MHQDALSSAPCTGGRPSSTYSPTILVRTQHDWRFIESLRTMFAVDVTQQGADSLP